MIPVTTTVLLHTDRTECHHDGPPLAVIGDDGGPLCPDGRNIAWVQYGPQAIPIDTAYASLAVLARIVFDAAAPERTAALAAECARISADPAVQALAAAAAAIGQDTAPWSAKSRGTTGDPCGSGPLT